MHAVGGGADEAGDDRNLAAWRAAARSRAARLGARLVHQRLGAAELVGRDDQLGRIDRLRRLAPRARDGRGDERRREHLAGAGDRVEQPRRQLVHHRQAETELLEPIEPLIDVSDDGVAARRHRPRSGVGRRPCARSKSSLPSLRIPLARSDAVRAAAMSVLVTLLIAEVTTTTWWPCSSAASTSCGGLGDALGGPDRGPAEFHDDEHMAGSIIDETPCPAEALGAKAEPVPKRKSRGRL